MKAIEVFNAMRNQDKVKVIDYGYIGSNDIDDNSFLISSIYSDDIVTLIDEKGNLFSELSFDMIEVI